MFLFLSQKSVVSTRVLSGEPRCRDFAIGALAKWACICCRVAIEEQRLDNDVISAH